MTWKPCRYSKLEFCLGNIGSLISNMVEVDQKGWEFKGFRFSHYWWLVFKCLSVAYIYWNTPILWVLPSEFYKYAQ